MQSVRWHTFGLCLLLSALFSATRAIADLEFTLYHQLLHSDSAPDISPRGLVTYDPETNTVDFAPYTPVIDFTSAKGIYRIGGFDSKSQQLSPAAFTRLDNVDGPVTEEITLFLTSDNSLHHISYFVKPSSAQNTFVKVIPDKAIPVGPDPVLNDPVVVNPDGEAPKEEVEKTFLQKYWVYIIPLLFILLTSGGGLGQQQQEGGGGQGGGN